MERFNWTQGMSVGQPALDSDHRCLVRIINLLDSAEGSDRKRIVQIVLDTLSVYCRYHFSREEQLMRSAAFPGFDTHCEEHEAFTRYVEELRRQYAGTQRGEDVDVADLLAYLTDWLRHHILIQDMAYKPYVAGNIAVASGGGGSPIERQSLCHGAAD